MFLAAEAPPTVEVVIVTRAVRRLTLPLAAILLAATACGTEQITQPPNPLPSEEADVTAVRITVADRTITARLADNPTARDLAGALPLTLTFRDFNGVEKVA